MIGRLRDLRFRHKVLLLPISSTVAFVLVLAADVWVSRRNDEVLLRIQQGHLPALEASRDLEAKLGEVQRSMQDAVAAEDADALAATGALYDDFMDRIAAAKAAVGAGADAQRFEEIATLFESYFRLARDTSARMMSRGPAAAARPQVELMTVRYGGLRETLAEVTKRSREGMEEAFDDARRLGRASAGILAAMIVGALAAMLALATWIVGGVANPLTTLARAATRVADGDLAQHVEVASQDEIGELARAFDTMVRRLRALPVSLREATSDLSRTVEDLVRATRGQTEAQIAKGGSAVIVKSPW